LAAIALPAYSDYVTRARRADAKSAILSLQLAQEQLWANCAFYAQNIGANDVCGATSPLTTVGDLATSPYAYYNLSVVAASASPTAYTLTALPQGTQATNDTECATFRLTSAGVQSVTGSHSANPELCWGK